MNERNEGDVSWQPLHINSFLKTWEREDLFLFFQLENLFWKKKLMTWK